MRALEIDSAQHHVRAPLAWIDIEAELLLRLAPARFVDEHNLPLPAQIRVADDAAAGDELRVVHRIHRAAFETFDPDGGDLTH
jgi:hypothetical protein